MVQVREFMEPAHVGSAQDTLAQARPWLAHDRPVFLRGASGWRVLHPSAVVGYPETRRLIDLPHEEASPVSPEDDLEILFGAEVTRDVLAATEGDALVGQIDRRRVLSELRELLDTDDGRRDGGALLARIAPALVHDLANALTVIASSLAMARARGGESEELSAAAVATDHSTRLLERFRTATTAEPDDPVVGLRVDEVVSELLGALRVVCGPNVRLVYEPTPTPPAHARRRLIERLVFNLVLNACEAMDRLGAITLRVEETGPEEIQLVVEDDGPGLPDDAEVFARGYTTKRGTGRGLGLSGVRRALHGVGARLDAGPSASGGARFVARLRVAH